MQQAFLDLRLERPAARAVLDEVARKWVPPATRFMFCLLLVAACCLLLRGRCPAAASAATLPGCCPCRCPLRHANCPSPPPYLYPILHLPRPAPRRYFTQFVTQSRNTRNRLDAAKELKKLVFFSNIVVAPLLEDLKVGAGRRGWLCGVCWGMGPPGMAGAGMQLDGVALRAAGCARPPQPAPPRCPTAQPPRRARRRRRRRPRRRSSRSR